MTFKETLDKAREVGINAIDLDIATEVSSNIEEEITDEKFNQICNLTREAYLKSEYIEVWAIVKAILDMVDGDIAKTDITSISKWDVLDKASYYS